MVIPGYRVCACPSLPLNSTLEKESSATASLKTTLTGRTTPQPSLSAATPTLQCQVSIFKAIFASGSPPEWTSTLPGCRLAMRLRGFVPDRPWSGDQSGQYLPRPGHADCGTHSQVARRESVAGEAEL